MNYSCDLFAIDNLCVIARGLVLLLLLFLLLCTFIVHIYIFALCCLCASILLLSLLGELLKLLLLYSLRCHILLDLACLEFIHSLYLFLIFLVLDIFIAIQVVIEVDDLAKGDTIQDFYSLEGRIVKGESVEGNSEDGRSCHQFDTFLGIDFCLTDLTVVLIITIENLRLDVVFKGHLDRRVLDSCAKLIPNWQR